MMDTVLTVIKENGKHRFVSCAEAVFFSVQLGGCGVRYV